MRYNVRAYVPNNQSALRGATPKNHIIEDAADEADAVEEFKRLLGEDLRGSPAVEEYVYEVTEA